VGCVAVFSTNHHLPCCTQDAEAPKALARQVTDWNEVSGCIQPAVICKAGAGEHGVVDRVVILGATQSLLHCLSFGKPATQAKTHFECV
jgi:hypothetical protein